MLVALISAAAVITTALLALFTEARKGRKVLGESKGDGPTIMEVLIRISEGLGAQQAHNAIQDKRLATIEGDLDVIGSRIHDIDGRVLTIEELAIERQANDQAAREGRIERRANEDEVD